MFPSSLEDQLVRQLVVCRNDSQDDALALLHIALDELVHDLFAFQILVGGLAVEDAGKVDESEGVDVWTSDLNTKDVPRKLLGAAFSDSHDLLGLVDDVGEGILIEVLFLKRLSRSTTLMRDRSRRRLVGKLDGNLGFGYVRSSKNKLGGKARTQIAIDRKAHARDSLKNGALSRGLVADHDDLRQIDKIADPKLSETVNGVEQCLCVGAGQLRKRAGVKDRLLG